MYEVLNYFSNKNIKSGPFVILQYPLNCSRQWMFCGFCLFIKTDLINFPAAGAMVIAYDTVKNINFSFSTHFRCYMTNINKNIFTSCFTLNPMETMSNYSSTENTRQFVKKVKIR